MNYFIDFIKIALGLYFGWAFVYFGFDSSSERFLVSMPLISLVLLYYGLPKIDKKD